MRGEPSEGAARAFRRRADRPLVLGHRGAAALAPENTLAAIRAARRAGADGIEIDVRMTRDGALVVLHDLTLERLASRPDRVADAALADLRDVRVRGEPIATLAEALDEAQGLLVNVEIKSDGPPWRRLPGLERRVADELRGSGADRVLVSSFDPWVVRRFRRAAPEVPAGLLLEAEEPAWLRRRPRRVLGACAIHPEVAMCDAGSMARWRAAGLVVVAWTVRSASELLRVDGLEVDAVIADDPSWALSALGDR
jgi:glycerophosphoryl diester phosphodiesterase